MPSEVKKKKRMGIIGGLLRSTFFKKSNKQRSRVPSISTIQSDDLPPPPVYVPSVTSKIESVPLENVKEEDELQQEFNQKGFDAEKQKIIDYFTFNLVYDNMDKDK
jgi:hypothetical protein